MSVVESLPGRPLRFAEVERLDEQGAMVGPMSGFPGLDLVFAVVFITDEWMYGLGFDEDRSEWLVIDRTGLGESSDEASGAWERIDTAINEWIETKYGERYDNIVMEV